MALPQPHPTTEQTIDGHWVFGHTQKQTGSILQSGTRAIVTPSPITRALSTMQGRMMARTMQAMGASEKLFTYAGFRPYGVNEVIKRVLPEDSADHIIVDPACGYTPQFYWLASERRKARFIEIDQPETIQNKRSRLEPLGIPDNLEFIEADLSESALHTVLGERKADLLIALAAYVELKDYAKLLDYLPTVMKPDGVVFGAFPYAPGFENLTQTLSLFRRVVAKPIGIVEREDQITSLFRGAGYRDIQLYRLSDLAKDLGKPAPADAEIFVTARR